MPRLAVGTRNKCKLAAVAAVQATIKSVCHYTMTSHKVKSGIKDQPDSLDLTIVGAKNRARAAYEEAKKEMVEEGVEEEILALGIESGLFFTPADGRCFDVCVCSSTVNGVTFNQGMSCAFEVPPPVARFVKEDGMDLCQASNAAGLTNNTNLGEAEGLIGILSQGRVTRQKYTEQAVTMSLLFIGNEELYRR
jgi:inosine/xanthosine triphosphatase